MAGRGSPRIGAFGKAWVVGGVADRTPRTRLLASCVQHRPAGAARIAACVRGAYRVGGSAPMPTRNPAPGATGEKPMTTMTILLINSIAQLIAAVAQLVAALRR